MGRRIGLLVSAALVFGSCSAPEGGTPSPTATVTRVAAPPTASLAAGLPARPETTIEARGWALVPDGSQREGLAVRAAFPRVDDAAAGRPRARLRSTGATVDLVRLDGKTDPSLALLPPQWSGTLPLEGVRPGDDAIEILVRLADGSDVVAGTRAVIVSQPVYVVWTADFEGDAASDAALANTAAIADGLHVPITIMWNARVWTTTQVSAARADAMLAWTKDRAARGDEVALHVHAWTDFVRAAGVTPRTAPNWSGRSDGYDVPLTAFSEDETGRLLGHALRLMSDHGLPRPTTFRGGGLFANAANLRAVAAAGFTVDTSGAPAGGFGRLPLPWTLAKDAQPYRPSRDDANAPGDLPLLEVPNIAGNTYGYTTTSIQTTIRDDIAMIAPPGRPDAQPRVLTLVSHPATIDEAERAAIEALFRAFEPYRYDRDAGPLRFVTMSQLAKAYPR